VSDRLLVGTRKGLLQLERSGGWHIAREDFLGENVVMTLADPRDGACYAAIQFGHFGPKLRRSDDGGQTWKELTPPAYPEKPEGLEDVVPWSGAPIPWNVELIWSLEPGGMDHAGRLWCGTIPGGLFRSEDRGESWELVRSLWDMPERHKWGGGGYDYPGLHSICVDPRDSAHLTIAISTGGVWTTRDEGATWSLQGKGLRAEYMPPELANDPISQDVHRLVQCPASPDSYWVQHHNGVFKSTDGADTFSEITDIAPSKFGFAAAVHPSDPNTAWLVPAIKDEFRVPVDGKMVVNRTRDGGKTWENLRNGLPQEHAYDLVYRHGLTVDGSGTQLAMGSTTGSLWTTENQGDTWQTISTHLPPIACVRFVPD
jgi:hypothetical protein